jgi:hypothetical protein
MLKEFSTGKKKKSAQSALFPDFDLPAGPLQTRPFVSQLNGHNLLSSGENFNGIWSPNRLKLGSCGSFSETQFHKGI